MILSYIKKVVYLNDFWAAVVILNICIGKLSLKKYKNHIKSLQTLFIEY